MGAILFLITIRDACGQWGLSHGRDNSRAALSSISLMPTKLMQIRREIRAYNTNYPPSPFNPVTLQPHLDPGFLNANDAGVPAPDEWRFVLRVFSVDPVGI